MTIDFNPHTATLITSFIFVENKSYRGKRSSQIRCRPTVDFDTVAFTAIRSAAFQFVHSRFTSLRKPTRLLWSSSADTRRGGENHQTEICTLKNKCMCRWKQHQRAGYRTSTATLSIRPEELLSNSSHGTITHQEMHVCVSTKSSLRLN